MNASLEAVRLVLMKSNGFVELGTLLVISLNERRFLLKLNLAIPILSTAGSAIDFVSIVWLSERRTLQANQPHGN